MSDVRQMIREEAARRGAIPFARFMDLALYCPNFGYYEQLAASPGRQGNFFTSVSVGPLFGELLATQFAGWLENLSTMPPATTTATKQILEAGAHDGRLALDLLRWLRTNRPALLGTLEYWILEPSARRRQWQEETLREFSGRVRWFEDWNALPPSGVNGVIFSNELLDAFPVHRLGWDAAAKNWFEWAVTVQGDDFVWTKIPLNSQLPVPVLPAELLAVLPDNFTTEISPAATDWWRHAARALKTGKLLTLDYGLTHEQFFTPERKHGTLRAYHRHHQTSDLLANPGDQDLTAHVNFTALRETGESAGLRTEALIHQSQFLTAIVSRADSHAPAIQNWTPAQTRQFQTLTHPEHLGHSFQVLLQSR
jgi:SAM-dependent MidA family methyltransferase